MEGQRPPSRKKSLCRFYLRGLCVFTAKKCAFSHGVQDMDYECWKEDEYIQYEYHKKNDAVQKNYIKGPRIFKNLYEFQNQKIFTLQQLNEKKSCRFAVREMMHRQLYQEFTQLLELKYPHISFTEEFLIREFTRVGFNKILLGPIKLNNITAFLCDHPESKYFKTTKIIPPNPNKQTIVVRKANYQQILQAYKIQYQKIIAESQNAIEENLLKKKLFAAILPENIPPLNQVLKEKKVNLPQFLVELIGKQPTNIKFEASIQSIREQASKFVHQNIGQKLITWNDIYIHLTKALKTNNGNILNQVKPHLVLQHNAFLFFPTHQFIYNPKVNSTIFSELKQEPCKCSYQQPFPQQELMLDQMNWKGYLKEGESYDINDFSSLMEYAPHIINSDILGVDLEGNLRKGGFVQMIQLNNGKNTFLLDIWHMNEMGDFQAFWLSRKIIRKIMIDPKIVKIFHDCRHDSIGLHQIMQTCIVNVFDTSACETLIAQLELYNKLWQNPHKDVLTDCKNTITHCNNVKTPGLNQIFTKYQASHGINKNKERFHKMWSKGEVSFFCKRPLDHDYRQYCIKDVLDLPEVFKKMFAKIPKQAVDIAYWISAQYVKFGYLSLEASTKKQN